MTRYVGMPKSEQASPMVLPGQERLFSVLERLDETMRKNDLALRANLEIPTEMIEQGTDQNNTILTLAPKSSNMFRVLRVAFSVPAGATAVMTLGSVTMTVAGGGLGLGFGSFGWRQTLNPDDVRSLTSSVLGPMQFVLMGTLLSRSMLFR